MDKKIEIVQKIIDKKKACTYLEIGVYRGKTFFPVNARKKIAVDPSFSFSKKRRIKSILKNIHNFNAKYHETTSDDFFSSIKSTDRFDVVFVDGMHAYRESLRDVINSLVHLNENGIIIMHDCNPPNQASAYPAKSLEDAIALNLPGWTGAWCGDVWKTVCYLRSQRKDLRVFVLDADVGLGIVMRRDPESLLSLSEEVLDKMTYEDLDKDRRNLLNLKDENYFSEFLETI